MDHENASYLQSIISTLKELRERHTNDNPTVSKINNEIKRIKELAKEEENVEVDNKEDNNDLKISNIEDLKNIKLTSKSRNLVILRVLILFLICIYIPVDIIFAWNFDKIEKKLVFDKLDAIVPDYIYNSKYYSYTCQILFYMLGDKDIFMIYSILIYICFHPFTAVKITLVSHFTAFVLAYIRCLYQNTRPLWKIAEPYNFLCPLSYANPSLHFYFVSFYFLYTYLSIVILNKKKKKANYIHKCSILIFTILLIIIFGFVLILNKINYIYQLNFAFTISIVIISKCLDLESYIHNFILSSLKNIYKIRRYKINIFITILVLNLFAVISYNFLSDSSFNELQRIIYKIDKCKDHVNEVGLKSTFLETTYSYGVISAFWGASLTVEKNCGNWWKVSKSNLAIKLILTILLSVSYLYLFNSINSYSFEFNYIVSIIKYLLFYYLFMGLLPMLFDKLKMNKIKKNQFFRDTKTSYLLETKIPHNNYSKSMIVGGISPKTRENLEFINKLNSDITDI